MKVFDDWNHVKKKTETEVNRVRFKERDILFIRLGKNIGHEQDGKGREFIRPVVVLRKFNDHIFLGVPMSTTQKTGKYYFSFPHLINKKSSAIISQLRLIDSRRIVNKRGMIDMPHFQALKKVIIENIIHYDDNVFSPTVKGAIPKEFVPQLYQNDEGKQDQKSITVNGLTFNSFIKESEIKEIVKSVAAKIKADHKDDIPLFVGVLNGVIHFISELILNYDSQCEVDFIKLSSYEGTDTSGKVKVQLDLTRDLTGRTVIIVEDVVDTGLTLDAIMNLPSLKKAKQLKICTLFLKTQKYHGKHKIDYIGKEIPPTFITGHGFDLDGLNRNLRDIYKLTTDNG